MFLLLLSLPFLVSASKPQVNEWEVTRSVPLIAREYASLIKDFTVCRGCFTDILDITSAPSRPTESLLDIVGQLTERHIPQILGLMDTIDKTGAVVQKIYDSDKRRNISAIADLEEHEKSWYVQMRLAEMRNKLLSLAEKGTVYGRVTRYGAEVRERFNTRYASLNDTLIKYYVDLANISNALFQAEIIAHPAGGLPPDHQKQYLLRRDLVSKEAAWTVLDFLNTVLAPDPEVDDCLFGQGGCRGQMKKLVAFLEDELIPFLRTIYGVAWSQPLPHRHEQWRDTFVGWFSHTLTTVVDFEAAGVGLAVRGLKTGISQLQRHLDSLRHFQSEDTSQLAHRLSEIRRTSDLTITKAAAEIESQTRYNDAILAGETNTNGWPHFTFQSIDTVIAIRSSLRDTVWRLYDE